LDGFRVGEFLLREIDDRRVSRHVGRVERG
jgi:hypothetical protein